MIISGTQQTKESIRHHLGKIPKIRILPRLLVGPFGILLLNLSCGMADAISAAGLVTQTLHYCVLLQHYWAGQGAFPCSPEAELGL